MSKMEVPYMENVFFVRRMGGIGPHVRNIRPARKSCILYIPVSVATFK